MNRFPILSPQELPAEASALVQKILSVSSHGLGGPFNLLLRSPAMARHFIDLLTYFNEDTVVLDPLCRRLAVLVVARHAGAGYAWWSHCRRALAHREFPQTVIDAIHAQRQPQGLTDKQAAVVTYVRELVRPGLTSQAAFAGIRRHMADDEIAELIALCGIYSAVALILRESETGVPAGEADTLHHSAL